ncbi:hypothetical protein WR25_23067 [Diploscapter pachys]|uniref:Uncharacterized protein n=1 Tax=Diploscapter pachys TaxID=2018661 RepID=A0A2A2KAG1_9BILA|nr:hypothetical protein WR25_23067 [Diploscapter pachys]
MREIRFGQTEMLDYQGIVDDHLQLQEAEDERLTSEPVDDSGEEIEGDSGAKLKEYVNRLKNIAEKKYYNTIRQVMGRVDKDEMDRALREMSEYVIKDFDQNEQNSILNVHERRKCGNDDAKDI